MAALVLHAEGQELDRRSLDKDETTIGSDSGCDVCIEHQAVSPLHAVVARDGRGFFIRDESSRWGIVDRGKRVKLKRLRDGDRITICRKFVLEFCAECESVHPARKPTPREDRESVAQARTGAQPCDGQDRYARLIEAAVNAEEAEQAARRQRQAALADDGSLVAGQEAEDISNSAAADDASAERITLTARELREQREAEDCDRRKRGLWGERLVVMALSAVILSTFSVAIAAAFF